MKILVTGAAGMLGQDLVAELSDTHRVVGVDLDGLDVTDEPAVRRFVARTAPQLVIHAAAYTEVDRAEKEQDKAMTVNRDGAGHVAAACAARNARMILISTDFVFDGAKNGPYLESDTPRPVNFYGQSKLQGEILARKTLPSVTVIRTAWLYGAGGNNFVNKILETASRVRSLKVVTDKLGSPTYAVDLARAIKRMIAAGAFGPLYHVAGDGACSRLEWAREILTYAGIDRCTLVPVTSGHFPGLAPRPDNSALASGVLEDQGIGPLRHWKDALREYLSGLPECRAGR